MTHTHCTHESMYFVITSFVILVVIISEKLASGVRDGKGVKHTTFTPHKERE